MHMRYSRSNAATIAACLRKKASNDDRLLRFRFRNHFGSAEFHCDSRREGEAAERPVRGEDSGFRQNKAAFGERHRINHHAVAAAGAQYRTRRRYARAGNTGDRPAFARTKRRRSDGYRRIDCDATQVGHAVRLRTRRRFRGYDASGVRVRRPSSAAGTCRAHDHIQGVRFRLAAGRRGHAERHGSGGRFHGRLVGVAMLAGDSGRPLPHRREHASCPTHADCTAHRAGRQAHPRPSACQESRTAQ